MDMIESMIRTITGDLGPMVLLGLAGVVLVAIALPLLVVKPKDPLERLKRSQSAPKLQKQDTSLRLAADHDRLERYKKFLEPQDLKELDATRLKLMRAGYRNRNAVRHFHFAQFALGIAGLILGVIYMLISDPEGTHKMILAVLVPGVVGYMAPRYIVTRRAQERTNQIADGFPDTLDLLLVCIEAGQSIDQSIVRVAREVRDAYPALADELEIVAHELKAGRERADVFRNFGDRVDVPDIKSFATTLIQAAGFGASIGDTLRIYAGEMRDKRVMRAEEKANKLPTKLTLGTMFFCLPPLMIILIGPSIYSIVQNFSDM